MRVEPGQLRSWLTTEKVILVIRPVPGTSNWMVLKQSSGIDYFSESILECYTKVINEIR